MKRRNFSLLAGTSLAVLAASKHKAFAQSAPADFATLSTTTLTPMGGERAGNAAGTIPAWTGGNITIPAGWDPQTQLPPDFFAGDAVLYTVNASNMAQYADLLTDGVKTLIQKKGFSIQVSPTHRTAAAPQWVYDNILQNAGRAALDPAGGRLGFSGGYGGVPFPVPDASDPYAAGAQIIWNHITVWSGTYSKDMQSGWAVVDGIPVCSQKLLASIYFPYYDPNGSLEAFESSGPFIYYENAYVLYPQNNAGETVVIHQSVNTVQQPTITWQLQLGLGRVRKAPELQYDTPSSYSNGIMNYDEFFGFYGPPDEYDWKLIGKREMLVPYNCNKLANTPSLATFGPKFPDPSVIRWELHRVWVVEATLHPNKRNVLARRRLYFDEDTWHVLLVDAWDANGNIYHHIHTYNMSCPHLPGTVYQNCVVFNLQTGDYASLGGPSADPPCNRPISFAPIPLAAFEPQMMAASASY
jgi:hypothetical protein